MITEDDVRRIALFASLDDAQVRRLADHAADIRVGDGDWVAREGDAAAFYVLLSGRIEISKGVGRRWSSLVMGDTGAFFGVAPLLLGAPFLASFRALEPSHLLRVGPSDFTALVAITPEIRQALTAMLLERVGNLEDAVTTEERIPVVIGSPLDLACHNLREFLARNVVDYAWLDPTDERDRARIPARAMEHDVYPVVVLPDDTVLSRPSLRQLADAVGVQTVPAAMDYDVVIVGGGPSGLSAAVYGASEGLHTLLVEGTAPGGQAGTSSRIENYLGFPIGITGDDLGSRALTQAQRFGAEIVVTRQVCAIMPGEYWHTLTLEDGVLIRARAIVLASGVTYRALAVPGIDPFVGSGVYYGAARTEALGMRGRSVYLIGGGNSAGQAALFFADYATRVTLLVRGPSLAASMSRYLIDQLATRPNITVRTQTEMIAVSGHHHLDTLTLHDRARDREERVQADGIFIFIGADANTDWLPAEIARDDHAFVLTGREAGDACRERWADRTPFLLETSVPGIFAAGDVRHGSLKRVASAVDEGSMAIAFIHQYLAMAPSP